VGFRRRRWRDVAPEKDKVRINKAIRVPEVRVINEEGVQLGVMPTEAARDIAQRVGLDLVELSPDAHPPVCKIMDYGRFKYEKKRKESTARKSQHHGQLKEVKFRPRIDDHDLEFKLKNARRFLMDGDKVKATVMFRGREMQHMNLGRELLARVAEGIGDLARPEGDIQMEGPRMLSQIFAADRHAVERARREMAARGEELEDAVPDRDDELVDEEHEDHAKEQHKKTRKGARGRRGDEESLEDEALALLEEIKGAQTQDAARGGEALRQDRDGEDPPV
jgi:translation initiation factor IF-3